MHHITRRLSPSLIIGLMALFLALAGTAAANSVLGSNDARGKSKSQTAAGEAQRSLAATGCETGNVLGFARVKGSASIPSSTYTSDSAFIDFTHNCSGFGVAVRRASAGVYFVRFTKNPAALALVTSNEDGASSTTSGDTDNVVTVGKLPNNVSGLDIGSFRVDVQDIDAATGAGHQPQDGKFTILLS